MKFSDKNTKRATPNSLRAAAVNNDLKKYQNDPVVIKKIEKAIDTLKKVGYVI